MCRISKAQMWINVSSFALTLMLSGRLYPQMTNLHPIASNGLWGYGDTSGRVVVPPRFEQAFGFHEGLANVHLGGLYGYINERGVMVIEPHYDLPADFSEGLAGVGKEEQRGSVISTWYGYINRAGAMAIPRNYSFASEFHEGLAAVEITEPNRERGYGFISHWGYIDKTGKMVIAPSLIEAARFSQGRASVQMKVGHAYIDRNGAPVFGPEDTGSIRLTCMRFAGGLAPIYRAGKVGFINLAGKIVVEPRFDSAGCFSAGMARVLVSGKYGYIDAKGTMTIPPAYADANDFSEALAAVALPEAGVFYINRRGEPVIRGPFRRGEAFLNGTAFVEDGVYGMGGYIDTRGKISNPFRIPEGECPICAAYRRPLLDMEIRSEPQGATVYLVPIYTFEHQVGIENDDVGLSNFRVPYGITNVSCKACVYEQKYWAVFVFNQRRCRMIVDILSSRMNKFFTGLDSSAAGTCK